MSFMSSSPSFSIDQILKDNDINDQLRQHLARVYIMLGITVFSAFIGVVAHLYFNIGGILSTFAVIGLLFLCMNKNQDSTQRAGFLCLLGFFKGCSIGPLIDIVLDVEPSILVTAFLATTTVFACFTLSALFAKRSSMLLLGGILSSMLSILFLTSIANIFVRSMWLSSVHLYLGLAVFCGYVLFDTQLIIEKFHRGDSDVVSHALELFIDFVAIFVRILIILLKNSQKDKKRK